MSEDLFSAYSNEHPEGEVPAPGQFRLSRLQVTNWGTFSGHHAIEVPRRGLLLTGESGSGKSSLLDAISAIMVAPQEAHFNSAATDAASGDDQRTPMSYVRGAHRNYTDDDTQEVRTSYLRSGPTCSGIAMTWEDGLGTTVSAIRLFHVKGHSRAAQDLRSVFALVSDQVELADWMKLITSGIDKKRLRVAFPSADYFDSYAAFGQQLRKRTAIGKETAQKLLHKALSAKSMKSLDQLLRTFMLDVPGTFAAADHAVGEFDDLNHAHAAVVDAREQLEVLTPIRDSWERRIKMDEKVRRLGEERAALPVFRAQIQQRDIAGKLVDARTALVRCEAEEADARQRWEADDVARDQARADLARGGGADLERATRESEELAGQVARAEVARAEFAGRLAKIEGLPEDVEDRTAFYQVIEQARLMRSELGGQKGSDVFGQAITERDQARREFEEIVQDIRALQARRTRIDRKLAELRDDIAHRLGQPPAALPFAGELMDVTEPEWTGAIERLASGFARTLLIPREHFDVALAYIDATDLRMRLVFECPDEENTAVPGTDSDAVANKLRIAHGRFEGWMRREVARRFPHVCVTDPAELEHYKKALSIQGTVKDGRRFTKDDAHPIHDKAHWRIGTTNVELLEELRARAAALHAKKEKAEAKVNQLDAEHAQLQERIAQLTLIESTRWETIDVVGCQEALARARERIAHLEASHSELAELRRRVEELSARAAASQQAKDEATKGVGRAQSRVADLQQQEAQLKRELEGASIEAEVKARLEGRAARLTEAAHSITAVTDAISNDLERENNRARAEFAAAEQRIARAQQLYASRWPGRVTNLVPDAPESAPDFLSVLDQLQADRLPEFENRFRTLLAEQSQNNLGRIREEISTSLSRVRKAIAPANESLAQTPFDRRRDRYLRIEPSQRQTSEVRQFTQDLTAVTAGAFNSASETAAQAEERFLRMKSLLERLGSAETADRSWRRRVLDTRMHVSFRAIETDAEGNQTDVYEGSGGRSGGQSQKLVIFCLVAALRYQLADVGKSIPRYGTVALDEAFDKTDAEFTEAGLSVFDQFQFQLILATPLKMLQTIARHVGGAVTVSNPTGESSRLSSITFTKVEDVDENSVGAGGSGNRAGSEAGGFQP
ncbi:MAG: ATP-binding protein [Trueperella sp.]|uniref:ATP-binding protein n=1 Tax=Trueperella sp. TaxID=2699835 RepID=UPI002A914052|nr:SbcC/MukB-like Walker B domain-containing protein [Trueperella sp.]MDY5403448.1 ATP-binding protein [Trueperella sp.]